MRAANSCDGLAEIMRIESTAFRAGQVIPSTYTCEGQDISPELHWSDLPHGCESLALIVDDPDAPDPAHPKRTWVHWVLYDIPSAVAGLPESVTTLPPGTRLGKNDWNRTGWGGPCPPIGEHRYFFKIYALDTTLGDLHEPTAKQLSAAMHGHVLAHAELIGLYAKRARQPKK
jgi:hypothetical protein